MQATRPESATTATFPPTTPISKNDCCLSRTAKIALAIFASLAVLVFLPFEATLTLSVVVGLGTIVCWNGNQGTPPSVLGSQKNTSPSVVLSPDRSASSLAPTKITIVYSGVLKSIEHSTCVYISFQTQEALKQFVEHHKEKFLGFASCDALSDSDTEAGVQILENAMNDGINSSHIITELEQIFGREAVMQITRSQ